MTRCLLTAATIGTLAGVALSFGPHGALGVAVCAAAVIAWFGVVAVRDSGPKVRYWTQDWREIKGDKRWIG